MSLLAICRFRCGLLSSQFFSRNYSYFCSEMPIVAYLIVFFPIVWYKQYFTKDIPDEVQTLRGKRWIVAMALFDQLADILMIYGALCRCAVVLTLLCVYMLFVLLLRVSCVVVCFAAACVYRCSDLCLRLGSAGTKGPLVPIFTQVYTGHLHLRLHCVFTPYLIIISCLRVCACVCVCLCVQSVVPLTMIASIIVFRRRYWITHYIGAVVVIGGVVRCLFLTHTMSCCYVCYAFSRCYVLCSLSYVALSFCFAVSHPRYPGLFCSIFNRLLWFWLAGLVCADTTRSRRQHCSG